MKKIKLFEQFTNESVSDVARISAELAILTKKMKEMATSYKDAEGDTKEQIKDELKELTIQKKVLQSKLDDAEKSI